MLPTTEANQILHDEIPIIGSAMGGLRFELILNAVPENGSLEDMEVPFAILSTSGHLSQTYMARIAIGEDATVQIFALKMQRNEYPPNPAGNGMTNKHILKLWEIERNNLSRFIEGETEIVGLFDFGHTLKKNQKDSRAILQSKPITFCKRKKVYLHPLCPECVDFLIDCQDDGLLLRNGLPSWSTSNIRYLYCPQCTKQAKNSTFYTFAETPEELLATKTRIRRRTELYRDFSDIIQNKDALARDKPKELRLARSFPCYTCDLQSDCYPANKSKNAPIPAETRLVPLSYYECAMLPLELMHIHYDEFIDLLGGALWPEFENKLIRRGVTSAQTRILNQIRPFFSSSYQFIFKEDPTGLFVLEILRLKFIAFTQLCRGVEAVHTRCRQPHLDLSPESVMVKLSLAGKDLPARWNFGIKLLDLGATMPFTPEKTNLELFHGIFTPPHNFQKIYTSPIIAGAQFGHENKMNIQILKIKNDKKEKKNGSIEVELDLLSGDIRPSEYCKPDLMRINLHSPAMGLNHLNIWAHKSSGHERGIRASGTILMPDEKTLKILGQNLNTTYYNMSVAFYKTYFTPCDVYSLGVMLFRTILVNDKTDLWQIMDYVDRIIFDLGRRHSTDNAEVEITLRAMLEQNYQIFSPHAIFFRSEDRENQKNAISDDLWTDILVFAFKLVTNIPGFSFCADHGDYDYEQPGKTMQKIIIELEALNARIHSDLFGSCEENKEILEVCDAEITKIFTEEQNP